MVTGILLPKPRHAHQHDAPTTDFSRKDLVGIGRSKLLAQRPDLGQLLAPGIWPASRESQGVPQSRQLALWVVDDPAEANREHKIACFLERVDRGGVGCLRGRLLPGRGIGRVEWLADGAE